MTNKKLWLSLLVVVLVVCMLSVTLFACKKDDESKKPAPTPGPTVEAQAIDAIINGIKTSVADGDMTDLKVDGTLGLTLGDKEYALKLALELDLLQFNGYNYAAASGEFDPNGEYFTKSGSTYTKVETPKSTDMSKYYIRVSRKDVETIDTVTPSTLLHAELKDVKANETLLGVYYADDKPGTADIYQGNGIYIQAKTKKGQKKVVFPAPFVSAVQSALNGQVDFHGIDLADEDVWGSVDTVTGIIAGLASDGVCTSTEASITLKIGDLLDPNNENNLLSLVSGLQDWLNALDLDIDASALGELLPNISLVLSATLDNGKATGFDISLTLAEKDMVIKNKSKDHTVIKVNMDKDVTVGLSLDYTIGTCTPFWPADINSYVYQENIIDIALSADLYLSSGINMSLLDGKLTLNVLPGSYTLSAQIAANPFAIISKINNGIDFSSTPKMIDSIKEILQVVNALELKLVRTKDGEGADVNTTVLYVLVGNTYEEVSTGVYKLKMDSTDTTKVAKTVTLTTTILGDGTKPLSLSGASVNDAIGLVNSFIDKGGDQGASVPVSTADGEDDDTTKLLKTIGGYLLGAYIGINDGTNGALFASFDSAATKETIIPFSGYTEWTGAYNSAFTYYTQKTAGKYVSAGDITAFDPAKTYYTYTPGKFELVDQTKGFDDYVYYYTKNSTEYTRQDSLKSFAAGTDYYVWKDESYDKADEYKSGTAYFTYQEATYEEYTYSEDTWSAAKHYVKGKSDGGDFGIGLAASLKIDKGIEINATVKNMDIFGLPATITAKIGNLSIEMFNNDYPIYFSATETGTYQDVAGKIQG